jgi:hypothetical protein
MMLKTTKLPLKQGFSFSWLTGSWATGVSIFASVSLSLNRTSYPPLVSHFKQSTRGA